MKVQGPGNTIVWDAQRGKRLCQFKDGVLETEDVRTLEILQKNGYKLDKELVITDVEFKDEEEVIRQKARELGIKSWHNKNIDKLKGEIAEKEGE